MIRVVALACSLFVWGWAVGMGCAPTTKTTQQVAAEAAYGGALLACVDRAQTLAESKACRAEVDRAWGITQTEAGR